MVKLEITPLTEEEVNLVQASLEILSTVENRREILQNILTECPELEEGFKMVVGIDRQSAFLMNMMKRGFNYICYESFDTVFDIFVRHPKYNITLHHFSVAYQYVIECIQNKVEKQNEETTGAWKKLCDILEYIADQAYNRPSEKKLKKMKNRVMRSMREEDIECVQTTWKQLGDDEIGVADILAAFIQKEQKIIKKFHEHNIDVFKQSLTIFRMISSTLKQLDDIEMLIPFLKKLGKKHVDMGVGPRLLASMKPIVFKVLEKALGFGFTQEIKMSWNKVLSFIIGIMVEVAREGNGTTKMSVDGISDDIDSLMITDEICRITQETWRIIDRVIDKAVESFYKDLLSSKPEIRNLFSRSNMASQAQKLLRAIGSTVALLDNPETLIPILEELGRRHVYYNVQPKYFKYLKKAWFNMLKRALTLKFTPKVESAWDTAWKYIVSIMKGSLEDALLLYIPPEPQKVSLKVLINHIDRVQAQNLSFYGDIWYAAYTGDNPSQSAAFGSIKNDDKFYDINNMPAELAPFGGVRILNSMDTKEMYRSRKEKYLRKFANDDTWYMRGNVRGTFAQMFNLRAFPFDQHQLTLTFALETDDNIAILDEESLFVRLMPFKMDSMAGADWDVYDPQISIVSQSAMSGGSSSGKRYTHAKVSIPISRKWTHHIYETILPLLLIELVAWGVYFAEEFPMVERLAVVVTLLLTLFAFKWTVAKSLPPTPYLTLMDHFFNAAYLLLFLHICGLALITTFHEDADHSHYANWAVCFSTATVFFIIHSYLLFKMRYYCSLYPKKSNMSALEAVARTALKSPSKKHSSVNDSMSNVTEANHHKSAGKYRIQPITHEA